MRIFISYRRGESSGYSRLLYDSLRAKLPDVDIFMDVEGIALGKNWREVLQERIAAVDSVLVLIGREWLSMPDELGRRRLDDPHDVTRWEIETALAGNKRVIPVLLEGAPPLNANELPSPLVPIAALQATRIQHETFSANLEALIESLTGKRLRDMLRVERGKRILERSKRLMVPSLVLIVFLLAWIQFIDFFTLDTRVATWTLALADALAPPQLDPSIALVAIPDSVDPHEPGTRETYGDLVKQLSAARASSVVLDIYFLQSRPAEDRSLADAIELAVSAGTQVFFGFTELNRYEPRTVPLLGEAASGVGLTCLGRRLGYALLMPLAFNIQTEEGEHDRAISKLPSLALLGAKGAVSVATVRGTSLTLETAHRSFMDVRFSVSDPVRQPQVGCKALKAKTATAALFIRLSPLAMLRATDRRFELNDLLADQIERDSLEGRTVIVGFETATDQIRVAHGLRQEYRYGYELYADAINTIKTGRITRPVGGGAQILITFALASAGAWFGIRFRANKPMFRRSAVGLFVFIYGAVTVGLAATQDLLLFPTYDVVALIAANLVFQRLSRRWLS